MTSLIRDDTHGSLELCVRACEASPGAGDGSIEADDDWDPLHASIEILLRRTDRVEDDAPDQRWFRVVRAVPDLVQLEAAIANCETRPIQRAIDDLEQRLAAQRTSQRDVLDPSQRVERCLLTVQTALASMLTTNACPALLEFLHPLAPCLHGGDQSLRSFQLRISSLVRGLLESSDNAMEAVELLIPAGGVDTHELVVPSSKSLVVWEVQSDEAIPEGVTLSVYWTPERNDTDGHDPYQADDSGVWAAVEPTNSHASHTVVQYATRLIAHEPSECQDAASVRWASGALIAQFAELGTLRLLWEDEHSGGRIASTRLSLRYQVVQLGETEHSNEQVQTLVRLISPQAPRSLAPLWTLADDAHWMTPSRASNDGLNISHDNTPSPQDSTQSSEHAAKMKRLEARVVRVARANDRSCTTGG
ncbi:hypothetical protein PINS_up016913 [Pythium insidiosum]|nr:hypothetical protein PINS_up016913 [Pythium insidiosum]